MIQIIIEKNDEGHLFSRADINNNLLIADGKTGAAAIGKLAVVIKEYEDIDIFETGFELVPQVNASKTGSDGNKE